MMNLPADVPVKPMTRIHHRLAYQHARWLLSQGAKDRFWFRTCRAIRRVFRNLWIFIRSVGQKPLVRTLSIILGVTIGIALAIIIVGLIIALPSIMLQLNPGRRPLQGADETISVSLTRLTILVSLAIPVLWCAVPGTDRSIFSRPRSSVSCKRQFSYLRSPLVSLGAISVRVLLPIIILTAWLVAFALGGILYHSIVATTTGMVFLCALAWFVYRVALCWMRHRAAIIWHGSLFEWLLFVFLFALIFSVPMMAGSGIVTVSQYLKWLGPIGYAMASLQEIADGSFVSLLPILLLSGLCVWGGQWVAKDAGTWSNRRRLILSRRLSNRADVKDVDVDLPERDVFQKQIEQGLHQAIGSRQFQTAAFYIKPFWLRRRQNWYWMIGGTMMLFVVLLGGMRILVDSYDPVATIGTSMTSPLNRLTTMFLIPFVFMLVCTEAMAMGDRWFSVPVEFRERPMSSMQLFWQAHCEGIARMPIQLLLALPFAALVLLGGTAQVDLTEKFFTALFAVFASLFALRTLLAGFQVFQSIQSITIYWVVQVLALVFFVSGMGPVLCMMMSATAMMTSEISPVAVQMAILAANVWALLLFSVFAFQRRKLERVAAELSAPKRV